MYGVGDFPAPSAYSKGIITTEFVKFRFHASTAKVQNESRHVCLSWTDVTTRRLLFFQVTTTNNFFHWPTFRKWLYKTLNGSYRMAFVVLLV